MTPHEAAIQEFLRANPKWQRYELRKKLNKIFRDEPVHPLGFIPDAFHINRKANAVSLLEVDGSSRLDTRKLRLICELWYVLDSLGWFCTLTTIHLPAKTKSFLYDSQLSMHWHDFVVHTARRA
jgi:hypothetical protein